MIIAPEIRLSNNSRGEKPTLDMNYIFLGSNFHSKLFSYTRSKDGSSTDYTFLDATVLLTSQGDFLSLGNTQGMN